jgi:acyl dehydratase
MNIMSFKKPADDRYFEDYEVGVTYELEGFELSEAEMIDFASQFDPQSFHVDPDAAKDSIYGGLIASGWHTGSRAMRVLVEGYVSSVASLGSPGVEEIRWPRPLRPGDRLTVRVTVEKARVSKSKPDRGLVHSLTEVLNQDGEVVMSLRSVNLILRRNGVDS